MKRPVAWRWIFGTLIGIPAAVCLLVTAMVGWIHMDSGRAFILRKVNHLIPGKIDVRNLSFDLMARNLTLEGISIDTPGGRRAIYGDRLRVHLRVLDLIQHKTIRGDVFLDGPDVRIFTDTTGQSSMVSPFVFPDRSASNPVIPDESNTTKPFFWIIDFCQVENGRLEMDTDVHGSGVLLESIRLSGSYDVDKRSGDVDLSVSRMGYDGLPAPIEISSVQCRAQLRGGRLDIESLVLCPERSGLLAFGTVTDLWGNPETNLRLWLDLQQEDIVRTGLVQSGYKGSLGFGMTMKGAVRDPDIGWFVQMEQAVVSGWKLDQVHLEGNLRSRILSLPLCEVQAGPGIARLSGKVDLTTVFPAGFFSPGRNVDDIRYDLRVNLADIRLDRWVEKGGAASGRVDGNIEIQGKGFSPETLYAAIQLGLTGKGIRLNQAQTGADVDASIDAEYASDTLNLRQIRLIGNGIRLEGGGRVHRDPIDVSGTLTVNAKDLAASLAPFGISDVAGSLEVAAHAAGFPKLPDGSIRASAAGLRFHSWDIGDVFLDVSLNRRGFLDLKEGTVQAGNTLVTASGSVGLLAPDQSIRPDPPVRLDISVTRVDPARFFPGVGIQSRWDADLKLGGSWKHPEADLGLRGYDIRLPDILLGGLSARIRMSEGMVRIESAELGHPDNRIRIEGQIGIMDPVSGSWYMDPDTALTIRGKRLEATRFYPKLSELLPASPPGVLVDVDAAIRGRITNPEGSANLRISTAEPVPRFPGPWMVDAQLADHIVAAAISGPLQAKARYGLETGAVDMRLFLENLDLAMLANAAGVADIGGVLSGTASLSGNIRDLLDSRVDISVSSLLLTRHRNRVVETNNLRLHAEKRRFQIPDARLSLLREGEIRIRGEGQISGDMDLVMEVDVPLTAAWDKAVGISDPAGRLTGTLRWMGPVDAPSITADIQCLDIAMTIEKTGQRVQGLNARIDMRPDRITIESLEGKLDDGTFRLAGSVFLDAFSPSGYDLLLTAPSLPVRVPDTFDGRFHVDLKMEGPARFPVLKGQIAILDSLYYRDVEISPLKRFTENRRTVEIETPAAYPDAVGGIGLDIRIVRRGQIQVDTNILQCDLNPDLHVTGTIATPLVTGRAAVENGTVFYHKRKFDITRGVVDFSNPYRIEPALDISAETEIGRYMVTIGLSGVLNDLKLALTSKPSLESGDILSLLVMGKTTGELIRSEGGTSVSTQQILTGLLGSSVSDNLSHFTGLDSIQIGSDTASTGATTPKTDEVLLSVGKSITPLLTIRYTIGTRKGESVQRTVAEYQLWEYLIASGFQDSLGSVGGGIHYRYEFR